MIKAPYNFVPLNNKVFYPDSDWADRVSHDIPFEDGESGVIELIIKAETPIFVRNGHSEKDAENKTDKYKSFSKIGDKFFIPGTTIKGTIRSVLEIFSFGRLSQYNNDYFAYRDFNLPQYRDNMSDIQCGWLQKKYDNKFYLSKRGEPVKVTHNEIKDQFGDFKPYEKDSLLKQSSLDENVLYPNFGNGRLVCTGKMNGKYHEYIFSNSQIEEIPVDDIVIQSFLTVHKPNPIFKTKWLNKINSGEQIPVFFTETETGDVHSLGLSYMYRYPFGKSVEHCIVQEKHKGKKDLSELLFGYTNADEALRGRVQFCHAFATQKIDPKKISSVSGVLGEPKASYYPLYLKQDQKLYKDYDNGNSEIAGRKRYRIHGKINDNNGIKELPQGNQNERMKNIFNPLPKGTEFATKINVHNLKPIELGALLSGITLHNIPNVYHNMGLAKSFGYGKVSFSITSFENFKYDINHYLQTFEKELSAFTYSAYKQVWSNTEQIKRFMQIAGDHIGEDILMMDLNEYKHYKKNSNFSKLIEADKINIVPLVNENEIKSEITENAIEASKSSIELTKEYFGEEGAEIYDATYIGNKKVILENTTVEVQCIIPKGMHEPNIGNKIKVVIHQYSKLGIMNQVKLKE